MRTGKIGNKFIIIEQGKIKIYYLDDRASWEIGRASQQGVPEIELITPTISRPHGIFKNKGGFWLYSDYCKLNGTTCNGKPFTEAHNQKILEDGDVFVFGGHGKSVINHQTVWGMYSKKDMDYTCRIENTGKADILRFTDGVTVTKFVRPEKGTVIDKEAGIGIYMGELTYLLGDIWLE